jgi:putative two-component system response regulator
MKRKIMIVDDDAALTRMVKRNLDATGKFDVTAVNEGKLAVSTALAVKPDLVLLDVMMPEIDGGDVAAAFADNQTLQNIPIVFLTAIVSHAEVADTGSKIGKHTFLAKPIKLDALITCIEGKIGV